MNLNNWLNDPATNTDTPEHSALLVECETVPDAAINALAALRQNTYDASSWFIPLRHAVLNALWLIEVFAA